MWLTVLNAVAVAVAALIVILILSGLDRSIERHNPQRWKQARWHVLIMTVICVSAVLSHIWWAAIVCTAVVTLDGWIWVRRWE